MFTFEQIKELMELVAQRHLQGVEVERSGFRLKIEGQASVAPRPTSEPSSSTAPAVAIASPASVEAAAAPSTPVAEPPGPPPGTHILNSPIVGTFYRASNPEVAPFTEVGARVKKGQVLCIVEAMKLMNEIESDVDGVVFEVYPQNAQAVEFGEPLFAIRPL